MRLAGAPNARDLGGLATGDGRRLRPGLLLRAPALGRLTDDDVAALDRLGLAEVIDLRHDDEIALAPGDRLPPGTAVSHLPIFDAGDEVFRFVAAVMLGQPAPHSTHVTDPATAMTGVYRWFVASPVARHGFGAALRRIASTAGSPVLFHCSAGKDRTGWLAAVVLSALGVDRDTIMADYLRTNTDAGEAIDKVVAALEAKRGLDPVATRPLLVAAPEYLDAAYAAVRGEYGSMDRYLRDGLDVDDGVLAGLRAALLD